jgi:hypothetical protein
MAMELFQSQQQLQLAACSVIMSTSIGIVVVQKLVKDCMAVK